MARGGPCPEGQVCLLWEALPPRPKLLVASCLKKGPKKGSDLSQVLLQGPWLPMGAGLRHTLSLNSPCPPGPRTVPWPPEGSGYPGVS